MNRIVILFFCAIITMFPASATAESYIIANDHGVTIKELDSNKKRPIASISKLMVSLLVVNQDLDEQLSIPTKRFVSSSIPINQKLLSRRELLTLSLVRSDNFATQILCSNIPNCIVELNKKAHELGMMDTSFDEPTGLSRNNISTASDLLKLLIVASNNSTITELSSMPLATIKNGKNSIIVRNTNPLTSRLNILLSKTGFTNPAGQCLVMGVRSRTGIRYYVLLGSKNRIPEMERLYKETS